MTLVPAVVLGKQLDGSYNLRVSLPPYNALTDDANDSEKFSFNSAWTDLIRTHLVGMATVPVTLNIYTPTVDIPFIDLGYIPHVEVRQADGYYTYDDRPSYYSDVVGGSKPYDRICWGHGLNATVQRGILKAGVRQTPGSIFYVIFKEAS